MNRQMNDVLPKALNYLCDVRKSADKACHAHTNNNEVGHQNRFLVTKLLCETVQCQKNHFHCGELTQDFFFKLGNRMLSYSDESRYTWVSSPMKMNMTNRKTLQN